MSDDIRRKLAITASSSVEDRTIDITTTDRRSGKPRRVEIVFSRRHGPDSEWPRAELDEWVARSAPAKVTFAE